MNFLAQVLFYVLQWLLTIGGRALYELVTDYVEKHKQKKIDEENSKKHKKNIDEQVPSDEHGRSGKKLINGEK